MLHLASNMRQMGHLARGVYTPAAGGPFGGHATLGTGLLGYWKFNETSGTTANDEVSTNDGTHTGVAVNETGILGKAVKYVDGTDFTDFGTYSALWDDSNTSASFSMWFKADDVSAATLHYLLAKSSNLAAERFLGLYTAVLGTGKVRIWVGDTGTSNNDYWDTNGTPVTSDNTWYHLAFTLNLTTNACKIYVNNNDEATTLTSAGSNITVFASNAITLKMGRTRNSAGTYAGMVNGYADELGIWNKVLTSGEVSDLYNSGNGLTY